MLQMTNERFMLMALVEEYSPSPTIRLTDEDTLQLYIGLQWKVHVISSFEHLSFKTIFNFFHQKEVESHHSIQFFHQKEVESHPKDGFHILWCTFTQTQKYINALFIIIYYSKRFVRVNHPSLISCLNRICRWPRRPNQIVMLNISPHWIVID